MTDSASAQQSLVLYAHQTMADWEYGYVVGCLGMFAADGFTVPPVVVAGADTAPVRSLGGLTVTPQISLAELDPDEVGMLVLPGGMDWDQPHAEVFALADQVLQRGNAVAGICGAVPAMAREGLLDEVPHTGNDPAEFDGIDYRGDNRYLADVGAVGSGDIITASGAHALEFTREVFRRLGLPADAIDEWYAAFS
ncbi:hypothetical protein CGZ94_07810 [Enemella evansiae]|uniref:DJ-1/PfpI domain-containing protein n=1 Tax=Enemella evansiae TaxID=2016499 RepID=A0A255GGE7_9ACTN|nr:DJ-1/PfpI family protein [Enemella evansiae]OYO14492.1 hypothetical protein CGZ94_07810 [Enemella evansiae]